MGKRVGLWRKCTDHGAVGRVSRTSAPWERSWRVRQWTRQQFQSANISSSEVNLTKHSLRWILRPIRIFGMKLCHYMSWLKMKTHFHTCDKHHSKKQIQVAFQAEHFVDLAQSFSEAILDSSCGCPRCGSRENVEWLGDVVFRKNAKVRCLLRGRSTQEPEMSRRFQGIRSNTLNGNQSINFFVEYCRTKDSFDPPADAVVFVGHWDSWDLAAFETLILFPVFVFRHPRMPYQSASHLETLEDPLTTDCGKGIFSSFTSYSDEFLRSSIFSRGKHKQQTFCSCLPGPVLSHDPRFRYVKQCSSEAALTNARLARLKKGK